MNNTTLTRSEKINIAKIILVMIAMKLWVTFL